MKGSLLSRLIVVSLHCGTPVEVSWRIWTSLIERSENKGVYP